MGNAFSCCCLSPVSHGGNDKSMFDWNDTLGSSGTMGSMQVFRIAPPSGRSAQVVFAYNNWQSSSSAAEFGIGNFAQHFWGGMQTLDYTYTKGLEKMNASAYRVKRIEIWTKSAGPEVTTTTDFPVPYSWIEAYVPGIAGQEEAMYETQAKANGANGRPYSESYVLGLDPTNTLDRFVTTIRMEGGKPIVEYFPTNEVLKASGAIEYILQGKPALSNGWQDVTFEEPGATNRFFRVKVRW